MIAAIGADFERCCSSVKGSVKGSSNRIVIAFVVNIPGLKQRVGVVVIVTISGPHFGRCGGAGEGREDSDVTIG